MPQEIASKMWYFGGCSTLFILLSISFADGQSDVRMPPYIIKGPKSSQIFRSEDSITLECKGDGIPSVTYEWKKNGFELNRNLQNIKSGADGTITIEPAAALDEGYYQCLVRNQYGTALSNTSHIQRALLDSVSGTTNVNDKTAREGEHFSIEAQPRKSFPKPTYSWELATDTVDNKPAPFNPTKRIQIDDNGNLHFAYAIPEDDLSGRRIYKSTAYNQYLDIKAGGSYTKVVVVRANSSQLFAPTLGFSSEPQTVGIVGESVSLRCFFYGNLEPALLWKGPGGSLPMSRYKLDKFDSELTINDIRASDQGDYICTASNARGQNTHRLQLRVEAKPSFKAVSLGPHNINVTDGEDAVFNCNAEAIPEANIVWMQNGIVLDVNVPPKKFSFSTDKKTLTIRSVCRSCEDPDRQTDLTVIQCNASNTHGYVFGSGYLNVLTKTQIIPGDRIEESVGIYEEKRFDFECSAVSDPSTPVTFRWYRVINGEDQMVYDDPPFITLQPQDGGKSLTLSIFVSPNGTERWLKYHGEYRCNASNGYSKAARWASIEVIPVHAPVVTASLADFWWIILVIAIVFILLIIVLCCCIWLQRNKGELYDVDSKERKNGNDPEKELFEGGFKDYWRPEGQTLRGSRGSLASSTKLNSDEEASLNEYGDDPGKFTEDGSFVGAYNSGTVDKKKGYY